MKDEILYYENLISYYTKMYAKYSDSDSKDLTKKRVIECVEELRRLQDKDDSVYEEMLAKVGASFDDLNKKNSTVRETENSSYYSFDDIELLSYIDEKITKTSINDEYNELLAKLSEDLESPNDLLIETWVNNYKKFVNDNSLNKEMMEQNLEYLFTQKYIDLDGEKWFEVAKSEYIKDTDTFTREGSVVSGTSGAPDEDTHRRDEEGKVETVIPEGAIEIVGLRKPSNPKYKAWDTVLPWSIFGMFGLAFIPGVMGYTIPIGLLLAAVMFVGKKISDVFEEPIYRERLKKFLNNNNIKAVKKDNGKFVLYDVKNGKWITKDELLKEYYEKMKSDLINIGAMDPSLAKEISKKSALNKMFSWFRKSWNDKKLKRIKEKEAKEEKMRSAKDSDEYFGFTTSEESTERRRSTL